MFNLVDWILLCVFFCLGSLLGVFVNVCFGFGEFDFFLVFVLWGVMGMSCVVIYLVGMKIMVIWMWEDWGFGLGLFVGVVVIGLVVFYGLWGLNVIGDWCLVVYLVLGLVLGGGLIVFVFVKFGFYWLKMLLVCWKSMWKVFVDWLLWFVNIGYLGYMWEFYVMWFWFLIFIVSF